MSLLPRRSKPQPTEPKPPLTPKGGSGRGHFGGFIQPEEVNADLIGVAGYTEFDRMWRTDGDVRKALTMVITPMIAASWEVQPYGTDDDPTTDEDKEIAEFVQWVLMENMQPTWRGHLSEALRVAARQGSCLFEEAWELTEWNGRPVYALKGLEIRLPRTIHKWNQDGARLTSVVQYLPNGGEQELDARNLVFYRFGAEGDNWEGESLLRPARKHWKYKDTLELIEAVGHERFHIGIPVGGPPVGAGTDEMEAFEEMLEGVRANESSYMLMPGPLAEHAEPGQGWGVKILTPERSGTEGSTIRDAINGHSGRISASVIEEFMRLGQEGVGARATADVQQDPFLMFCEALCGLVIEDPWNTDRIRRLVRLNFQTDRFPKLKASLIDATSLTELATFAGTLAEKGLINPDPILEEFLRKYADLPKPDPEAVRQREAMAEEDRGLQMEAQKAAIEAAKNPKPVPGKPPGKQLSLDDAVTLSRQDRDLRPWERILQLDRIESAIDTARDRFEQAASLEVVTLAQTLSQKPGAKPPVAPDALVAAIHAELVALYETGRHTVREELRQQAIDALMLAAGDPEQIPASLLERAKLAATTVTGAIWQAVTRQKLTPRNGPADVQKAGEAAAKGALRSEAQQHAAAALNAGRQAQADDSAEQVKGSYYTSILDGRACTRCKSADDDVLRTLSDPVRLEHRPPNPDCEGGSRCRCLEVYVLTDELAPSS